MCDHLATLRHHGGAGGAGGTYDTLDRNDPGDFGHGWSLELANFKVQTNRTLGQGPWTVKRQCIPNPQFGQMYWLPCFETAGPRYVTVTWPDGHTETFDLKTATTDLFPNIATVTYAGRTGTTSTLTPGPSQGTVAQFQGNLYGDLFSPDEIWNPSRFTLVAADGTSYQLDVDRGLLAATDRHGNTVTVTDEGITSSTGPGIEFVRDGSGRIDEVVGPDGASVQYERDAEGDLIQVTDPRGHETALTYVEDHYLREIDDPGPGLVRHLDYDPDTGRLSKVTDAAGNVTSLTVDPDARTEVVSGNAGRLTTISTYDERGNVRTLDQVHDGGVRRTTFGYDAQGRLTSRTNPNDPGRTWSATYDGAGNVLSVREPDGDALALTYNADQTVRTWTDGEGNTTTYGYLDGEVSRIAPPGRPPIDVTSDARGLVETITDPVGGNRSYTYQADGKVRTETTSAGTTTWTYDDGGRPVSRSGARGSATWAYDEVGNVVSETTSEGTTSWTYDHNDNVTHVSGPGGDGDYTYGPLGLPATASVGGATTSWTYQGTLVHTETTAEGTTTTDYDGARRQVARSGPDGDWTWAWDDRDRVTSMTRPDGSQVDLSWNDDGRLREVDDPAAGTSTYDWDRAGHLIGVAAPDGTTGYERNGLGQVTGRTSGPAPAARGSGGAMTSAATGVAGAVVTTPLPPASLDGLVPRPGEIPRPPSGPSEPQQRRRGGGGVLGEYAMLIDFDLSQAVRVARVGLVTYHRLELILDVLTQPTAVEQSPPVDIDVVPDVDTPTEVDEEEEAPPRPPRTSPCPDEAIPNYLLPVPGTYQGQPAPGGVLADLFRLEAGSQARFNPAGWQDQPTQPRLGRGHMIAREFGGPGRVGDGGSWNLVTMFQSFNNNRQPNPGMRDPERVVEAALLLCQPVFVDVEVAYHDDDPADLWAVERLPVDLVHYRAVSSVGTIYDAVLENRHAP